MSDKNNIRFLLGSNTKRGFVSLFDELKDPVHGHRLFIIKGGPGSGKSSLMKRIIKTMESRKHNIEYFHCASDPDSLDAFIDYDAKFAMMDGTAPHTMDPDYPGAYDIIVNMADCWDDSKLKADKDKIINLTRTISSCHRMASACISAAAALLDNNMRTARTYVNYNAVNKFIAEFMKMLEGCSAGREKKRLISAISVGQIVFFKDTLSRLASRIYVLPDEWGAASDMILSGINHAAALMNLERITCYCSIRTPDKIDHIIFPSMGIAITTSNEFHPFGDKNQDILYDLMNKIPETEKGQMSLHLEKSRDLINIACKHVKKAKVLHDELEKYYVNAMDFSKADPIYNKIMDEIL